MSRPLSPGRRRSPTVRIGVVVLLALVAVAGTLAATTVSKSSVMVGSAAGRVTPPVGTGYAPPVTRQWISLDGGWKFHRGADVSGVPSLTFDDSSWTDITVPHTWNAADGADGGNNYQRGTGWYRRHYPIGADLAGKTLFVQFGAANQVADVWINGAYLGQHRGGYSRFRFGATAATQFGGDNVIAVKVNNAADPSIAPQTADYTFDGGIYRSVGIWVVDPLQVRLLDDAGPGVYLRQSSVTRDSATVEVTTRLFNNGSTGRSVAVRTVITDADGAAVVEQTGEPRAIVGSAGVDMVQTVTIPNPHRWDGMADPYLYHANVEVRDARTNRVTDVVTEPLGLRSFAVDPETGFSLNGHPLRLHGVNLHQDRADVGWAVTDAQRRQDMDLVKEIGANAIRMAHYQHDQMDYSLADGMGFVVWAEIPFIDKTVDSPAFTSNVALQLRELIRQNYNHPSIVFWGIGNEQRADDAPTNTLLDRLAGIVRAEDPDRLSTYAHCCVNQFSPVTLHAQTTGYNKYYGWYTGSYDDLGGWLDFLHASNPARAISMSEYGAGGNIAQHAFNGSVPSANGPVHTEEYQALLHEASWRQIETRSYLWASFVWNMFDFASDSRSEGGQQGINDKGLVTRDRSVRKDAFYWYKANWAPTATLYVTSRRWVDRTVAATEIKVYSNANSVTATLNGMSLGAVVGDDHIFRWPVTLGPGRNNVTVSATINGATYTDTVVWHLGPPTPRRTGGD